MMSATPPPDRLSTIATATATAGGISRSSEHHDSGIENCNSSIATDHDREEDTTTFTSSTTHRGDSYASSASEDNAGGDFEFVNLTSEEVKVTSRPKVQPGSGASAPLASNSGSNSAVEAVKRLESNHHVTTSKAEKQRQNEEIIILESSSVSSETGSWESVTPEHLQQIHHHQLVAGGGGRSGGSNLSEVTALSNAAPTGSDYDAKPIRTACFIDASSLLDESELAALSTAAVPVDASQRSRVEEEDDADEPKIVTETKQIEHEIKDQFSSGDYTPLQLSGGAVNMCSDMNSSSESGYGATPGRKSVTPPRGGGGGSVSMDPKEAEKLKGSLVFKNSINQYSGVLIETDSEGVCGGEEVASGGGTTSDEGDLPVTRSFPLRNTRSDFTSLMDIYQENKRNGGGNPVKFNYMRTQSENHAEPQSIILPDTPHNSILNVNIMGGSRGRLRSSEAEDDHCESQDECRTPKRHLKYMESAPIVSGGVSVTDFSPKLCESPPVRRKLDTCPILSGGFKREEGVVEEPVKVVSLQQQQSGPTSLKSWVIDLNDLPEAKDEEAEKSVANKKTSQSVPTQKYSHFYVSLDDGLQEERTSAISDKEVVKQEVPSASSVQNTKKSTGFFVEFGVDEAKNKEPVEEVTKKTAESVSKEDDSDDKKNIFSMFIDFGDRKPVPKKESLSFTSRFSETINRRKELERRSESPRGSQRVVPGEVEKCTSLPFVPVDRKAEEAVQLRPKFRSSLSEDHQSKRPEDASSSSGKRGPPAAERPISFTAGDKGLMSIIDKIPLLSKTSSMSIDSSISPIEDFTCSKSEISTFSTSATSNSNNSSTKELSRQLQVLGGCAEKKHKKDAKIGETFDKSSQGSLTDGVLSKDLSPDSATATNTEDLTYQNEVTEVQSEVTTVASEGTVKVQAEAPLSTIPETNEKLASPAKKNIDKSAVSQEATHTMETLQATIEKQRKLLETVNEAAETTSFVRLSDMDKPFQSFEIYSSGSAMGNSGLSKSGGVGERRVRSTLDGRGTYYEKQRHNNMYFSTDTNIINLASSFENSRSLSRIFPHLSKGNVIHRRILNFN